MEIENIIKAAISLALATVNTTTAALDTSAENETEKCYGIVKKGLNDCQTASQSCASSATVDKQADAFILLPKGLCSKIVGGVLAPLDRSKANITPTVNLFTLDPNHTYVLWHASHFGFSEPSGKWMAKGTITFDKEKIQDSKINVTINLADITTGIPDFDKHLKGKLFFDVDHFPSATFVSKSIENTGNQTIKVHGILTLHGVSKEVVLDAEINKIAINPINNQETIGFKANTEINRSEFGIKTLLPNVGDKVKIEVQGEAYKPSAS